MEDSLLGTSLGGYRLIRLLGSGGMGSVYFAERERGRAPAAIKVLRADLSSRKEITARFFGEARATKEINHQNIVRIHEVGQTEDGRCYLVMEYLEGLTLARLLHRVTRLLPGEALPILLPVLDALAAAHRSNVIHRDLKPDNIFLARGGDGRTRVKLLDFGIAKLDARNAASATQTGATLGTPHYMSPEQAVGRAREVDARSDLYSIGVILYRVFTGTLPFDSDAVGEVMIAQVMSPPRPPREVVPDLPIGLEKVILRALSKKKEERFQSAPELKAALVGSCSDLVLTEDLDAIAARLLTGPGTTPVPSVMTTPFVGTGSEDAPQARLFGSAPAVAAGYAHLSGPHALVPREPTLVTPPAGRTVHKPRGRVSVFGVLGAMLLGLLAAVTVGLVSHWSSSHPAGYHVSVAAPSPAVTVVAAAPPSAQLAVLHITANADHAQLAIRVGNDAPVSSQAPVTLPVERGSHVHIEASATGYLPSTLDLDATADTPIEIQLNRAPAAPPPAHHTHDAHEHGHTTGPAQKNKGGDSVEGVDF